MSTSRSSGRACPQEPSHLWAKQGSKTAPLGLGTRPWWAGAPQSSSLALFRMRPAPQEPHEYSEQMTPTLHAGLNPSTGNMVPATPYPPLHRGSAQPPKSSSQRLLHRGPIFPEGRGPWTGGG